MTNDNISTLQNATSTISPNTTNITQLTESEDVTIRRPANHNEISIMENDWKQIRRKVNQIRISKHFNIPDIILGTIFPCALDITIDCLNSEEPNCLPLILCIVLYILSTWLAKKFPVLGGGDSEANKVHLNDLNELLNQADSSSS